MLSEQAKQIYGEIRWETISRGGTKETVKKRVKSELEKATTKDQQTIYQEIIDYLDRPTCNDCRHIFCWGSFSEYYCKLDTAKNSDRRCINKSNDACDKFKKR